MACINVDLAHKIDKTAVGEAACFPKEWDPNSVPGSVRQAKRLPYNIVGAPAVRPTELGGPAPWMWPPCFHQGTFHSLGGSEAHFIYFAASMVNLTVSAS